MPIDQKHCRAVFKKLDRELEKITLHSSPERVHKFRTRTRRVETVLAELVPLPDRRTKKLMKILHRMRRKAGKVRDLDVQMALLRNLKITRSGREKSQLLRELAGEREKYERKLAAAVGGDSARELHRRLKRASMNIAIPENLDPLSVALLQFSELSRNHSPISQKILHQYRIVGKQSRYLIEMAPKAAEVEPIINQLRKMQDVVGDWHDWLTLTERGEKLFGGVKDSALVAAMRNLTRAKFREAVNAVSETKSFLSAGKPSLGFARNNSVRKLPASIAPPTSAVA